MDHGRFKPTTEDMKFALLDMCPDELQNKYLEEAGGIDQFITYDDMKQDLLDRIERTVKTKKAALGRVQRGDWRYDDSWQSYYWDETADQNHAPQEEAEEK